MFSRRRRSSPLSASRSRRVLMLDLWATVPYYTAYLSRALQSAGTPVQVASMTYYLDRDCFRRCGLQTQPGLLDAVGHLNLPRSVRRVCKLAEGTLNLLVLSLRVLFRPPRLLHVQFLPLLLSRLPLDLWFVEICRWRSVPFVLTVHDLLPHDTGEAHLAVYARLYARADALICHSPHIKQQLVERFSLAADRIAVIPHGPFFFDIPSSETDRTAQTLGIAPGRRFVLWQGILHPYKGVDLLLNAWQQVERQTEQQLGAPAALVILGTGDAGLLASLTAQSAQLRLRQVHFHPRFCSAEELVAAYRAAALVVYPYRAITTSGALATGLSLGKAMVVSRLPVFEELLVEGETAMFADPSNPAELAEAILQLTKDHRLREGIERRVNAMNFSQSTWGTIARDTEAVYRSLTEPPSNS